jgi:SAM-dependent methyltransferase
LPFENEFFDAVFAGEVIEHLFDPDHFLDEVYRVLKHKGILVLTTPNLASLHNRIALLLGYQPFPMGVSLRFNIGRLIEPAEEPQSLDHIRLFTLRALKKLIELHGFRIVEVKGSSALLPRKNYYFKVIAFIDNLLTIIPSLAYRIIIVAEKI